MIDANYAKRKTEEALEPGSNFISQFVRSVETEISNAAHEGKSVIMRLRTKIPAQIEEIVEKVFVDKGFVWRKNKTSGNISVTWWPEKPRKRKPRKSRKS